MYKCDSCGRIVTNEEYNEDQEQGSGGYCYCDFKDGERILHEMRRVDWWEMLDWNEFDLEYIGNIPHDEAREYALNYRGLRKKGENGGGMMNRITMEVPIEILAYWVGLSPQFKVEIDDRELDLAIEYLEELRKVRVRNHEAR